MSSRESKRKFPETVWHPLVMKSIKPPRQTCETTHRRCWPTTFVEKKNTDICTNRLSVADHVFGDILNEIQVNTNHILIRQVQLWNLGFQKEALQMDFEPFEQNQVVWCFWIHQWLNNKYNDVVSGESGLISHPIPDWAGFCFYFNKEKRFLISE